MKKREQRMSLTLGPVKLYLDDIGEIVEALQEINGDSEIRIEAGKYELSSVAELRALDVPELDAIVIGCVRGSPFATVHVIIDQDSARVMCSDDTALLTGIFHRIVVILRSRLRRMRWLAWLMDVAAGVGPLGTVFLLGSMGSNTAVLAYIGYALAGAAVGCMLLYFATKGMRKSRVVLVKGREVQSLWQKHKDVWLLLIGAVVVEIVHIVFGWITR